MPIPTGFQGSCTINTGTFQTVAFVQMRFIGTENAAAYEALNGNSTDTTRGRAAGPQAPGEWLRYRCNDLQIGTQTANVTLTYKGRRMRPLPS